MKILVNFDKFYTGKIGTKIVLIEPQKFGRIIGPPLSPAHAMTIHKSQSLTIPYFKIDPSNPLLVVIYSIVKKGQYWHSKSIQRRSAKD